MESAQKTILIATDLDGTLLPNSGFEYEKSTYSKFNVWIELNKRTIKLAYISGRHLELIIEGIKEFNVPEPDYLVADVGTSVFFKEKKEWLKSKKWQELCLKDFQGFKGSDIINWLSIINKIILQEEEKQGEFKISYYHAFDRNQQELKEEIQKILDQRRISCTVIASIDHVKKIGLIDIIPQSATKENALIFLANTMGLDKQQVLYAGDTGNDLLPITSGYNAVLVGNAAPEIRNEVTQLAQKRGNEKSVFYAKKNYLEGIIEAINFFGLDKEIVS